MGFWDIVIAVFTGGGTSGVKSALTAGDRADDAQIRKDAAEKAAEQALANARLSQEITDFEVWELEYDGETFLKNQRATMGFSGVDINKGSALEVRNESESKILKDMEMRLKQGEIDYNTYMTDYNNLLAAAGTENTSWLSNFLSGL